MKSISVLLFVAVLHNVAPTERLNVSPCPNIFQFGLQNTQIVGVTELTIPKSSVYGFKVTQHFETLTANVSEPFVSFSNLLHSYAGNLISTIETHQKRRTFYDCGTNPHRAKDSTDHGISWPKCVQFSVERNRSK